MKLIKTKPRYKCDYCRHTGIKSKMEVHEKVCWRNPQRHCPNCNDTGFIYVVHVEGSNDPQFLQPELGETMPCQFCEQYDATKLPPVNEVPGERLVEAQASTSAPQSKGEDNLNE